MEKKFEFKQLEDSKCAFIMHSDDIERTEVVSEEYARNHLAELLRQKDELVVSLGRLNKELDDNRVERDAELENFIELANRAAKYKKYMDCEKNQETALNMLNAVNESIKAIQEVLK